MIIHLNLMHRTIERKKKSVVTTVKRERTHDFR